MAAVLCAACTSPGHRDAGSWVDLTHPFSDQTLYWPTGQPFELVTLSEGTTEGGWYYAAHRFSAAEHGGTHVDAPVHFAQGRWTVDRIPLERLAGPAVLVDVSEQARADRDYQISLEDLQAFERDAGRIPDGSILLLRTGYGDFWPDAVMVLGTDRRGEEAVPLLRFPGLAPEAARWLVRRRDLRAVGLDTPSIDHGQSTTFESHRVLLGENIPVFENVANLDLLPPTGAWVMALPMKIEGGSGAPLRIVARLP